MSASGSYLDVTPAAGTAFVRRGIAGTVVMLNLLRFRDVADYSHAPELAPQRPISGAAAFDRYVVHALPHLRASGGDIIGHYEGGGFLIGPETEHWDRVMLVRQASVASFLAFAANETYLAGIGHRTAGLADSRLLPLVDLTLPAGEPAGPP